MDAEVFKMTIPEWFSRFHREILDNLYKRWRFLRQEREIEDSAAAISEWNAKISVLEAVLGVVDHYLNHCESHGCRAGDLLACLRGDLHYEMLESEIHGGPRDENCFLAKFVFARGNSERQILTICESSIEVGWQNYEDITGIVCLRDGDLPEEFFDTVLHMNWGRLIFCRMRSGYFSASVDMRDCEFVEATEDDYSDMEDLVSEVEWNSHKIYDLAEEALDRDFKGGWMLDEAQLDNDYVLRYAMAIVRSLPDSPEVNMALHDLKNVFVQMRHYERISFDYMLLQIYGSEEAWRHEIDLGYSSAKKINFTAHDFMGTLYSILPNRLIGQCTRGAVGFPEEESEEETDELPEDTVSAPSLPYDE